MLCLCTNSKFSMSRRPSVKEKEKDDEKNLMINKRARQWCIAKNEGGYTQTGVAKGLKVPCLFVIAEVSIRSQKTPEVGIRRIPAYTPQYTTGARNVKVRWNHHIMRCCASYAKNGFI